MNLRFNIYSLRFAAICLVSFGLCGCASSRQCKPAAFRKFDFNQDSFAFANGLLWDYHYTNGVATHSRRLPKPDYALHCFAVARSARQFFQNARFDTNQPPVDDAAYRKLVRKVVAIDPRHKTLESELVVIPGYSCLRDFSATHEQLLKDECGSVWRSYAQRGHWRMVIPFSRTSQQMTAQRLLAEVEVNLPPVVHLVRFPQETINHAIVIYDARENDTEIEFMVYDPNHPDAPEQLNFDRATRTFILPANDYFAGGRVDVYEVYRNLIY